MEPSSTGKKLSERIKEMAVSVMIDPDGFHSIPATEAALVLDGALSDRIAAYEHQMKFGPTPGYWTEFVFEAYVNHRPEVIFLEGLPDVPQSRPQSGVYRR